MTFTLETRINLPLEKERLKINFYVLKQPFSTSDLKCDCTLAESNYLSIPNVTVC